MKHQFSRNELAIGQQGLDLLKQQTVVILGVGGVGSFAAEALARTNIGHIILIDKDDVDITNVNRQLHALTTTVGQSKVSLMEERIKLIQIVKSHLYICFIQKRHMKKFSIITI
ncbi:hesA/moeB/thiF family protein [Staphylococcus aureus]|nr:ThiF domain protein [Staphylococcus aureus subsp. aureus 21343]CAC6160512.1 hesA/moeB/thiF family protein [Staphylococcus aureus]